MTHGSLMLVADSQDGPRGASKTFVEGMLMIMASRDFGGQNHFQINAMLSPDAFMGKSGYPLLLQTGETADGVTPLVDHQHPHDLLMGLTARLTHDVAGGAVFVEAGYPGEFAFGPVAFMHRASGESFPNGADQPPLARQRPHHHGRGHRGGNAWTGDDRDVALHRPRTRRKPLPTLIPVRTRFDSGAFHMAGDAGCDGAGLMGAAGQSGGVGRPNVNLIKHSLSVSYGHDFFGAAGWIRPWRGDANG